MKRIAMTVLLKDDPEVIRKYEEYHANPWPEIMEGGYEMGIRRVFIYRFGRQLFMFLETTDDFDMSADNPVWIEYFKKPKTREWDELTRDMQEPVPGAPPDAKWVVMKEVHAFENGKNVLFDAG